MSLTLEDLIAEFGVKNIDKECSDEDILAFKDFCDPWEEVGTALRLSAADISAIAEDHRIASLRRLGVLQKWKSKFAFKATYRALITALLECNKGDKARQVYRILAQKTDGVSGGSGGRGSTHGSSGTASAANTSSDSPLTLPTLLKILLPVSSQWMNIGVMISLSHERLTAIETRCKGVPDNCLREMLNDWLKQKDPPPTKSALIDAVKMYDRSLADSISAL